MLVPVYDLTGVIKEEIELSQYVFGVPLNQAVVHQVLVGQLANARQGTVSTKTRGEVTGSTRKLFRQKGTGRARAGSIKSPLRRGGGITFGPKPRDYRQSIPKKMRRLALRCVLSAKLNDQELIIIENLDMEQPKTRAMVNTLSAVGVDSSVLIVTDKPQQNVMKSTRNIPGVKTTPADLLSVVDLLARRKLVMTVAAIRRVEELWGEGPAQGGSNAPVRDIAASVNN